MLQRIQEVCYQVPEARERTCDSGGLEKQVHRPGRWKNELSL